MARAADACILLVVCDAFNGSMYAAVHAVFDLPLVLSFCCAGSVVVLFVILKQLML